MTLPKSRSTVRTGFYSGSFDPVTLGHADVIERAARLVDRLVIGVGIHPGKAPLFTPDEKIEMLKVACAPIVERTGCVIEPVTFAGLTVDEARRHKATAIFRGLRDGTDLDYEMQMSGMNGAMAADMDTVFLPSSPAVRHVAASLVKQIAQMGGDVTAFVSADVRGRLAAKTAGAKM
jgi:pantetheine-phosphate adenylyltransferase